MKQIILTLIVLASFVSAQDTVYIANSGNNATITYKGTVQSVPLSLISASKFTGVLQPTRVAIFNGATQIQDWVFNNYRFKVNATPITNVDSFVPFINRLNTASVKSLKLLKDVLIVADSASIGTNPTITYLVGAQTSISITGLNGNVDGLYQIELVSINPSTNDTQWMRFNNVSTAVYDWRRSDLGSSYSGTSANAQATMNFAISTGSSMEQTSIIIDPTTGKNRTFISQTNRVGASQRTVATNYFSSGVWRDNSSNLTSIQFGYATITGGYGVGTRIRVFSLQP